MNCRGNTAVGIGLLAVCALLAVQPARAISSAALPLTGALNGRVFDNSGNPKMGAAVFLFNRQERLCARALTDERGQFSFAGLSPDFYSIRVTLATFLPAVRNKIMVQGGVQQLLDVSLSALFSSIQISPPHPGDGGLMSDDWKWVLRTANSTRPVLHIASVPSGTNQQSSSSHGPAAFRDVQALLRLSAGDGGSVTGFDQQSDLGTAFAVAASIAGRDQLQLSGDVGYGTNGRVPAAAFRSTYISSLWDSHPEFSLTVRQVYLAGHPTENDAAEPESLAVMTPLRTAAVGFADHSQITEHLNLRYGSQFDIISFGNHARYASPYAQLTYALPKGQIDLTFTDGNPQPDLGSPMTESGAALQRELNALTLLPRVSVVSNRAKVQRGQNLEAGISRTFGSREVRVSGYREMVHNAVLSAVVPDRTLFAGDLLADPFGAGSIFNVGDYGMLGYTTSFTQNLGGNYQITAMYGIEGALEPVNSVLTSNSSEALRAAVRADHRNAFTLRGAGTLRPSGTKFVGSYQWTDYSVAIPGNIYTTSPVRPEAGLNLAVRQPMPALGMPGRMEASIELRNLLAQGYLPLTLADGRRMLLVQTPRSLRGGVSFTF